MIPTTNPSVGPGEAQSLLGMRRAGRPARGNLKYALEAAINGAQGLHVTLRHGLDSTKNARRRQHGALQHFPNLGWAAKPPTAETVHSRRSAAAS